MFSTSAHLGRGYALRLAGLLTAALAVMAVLFVAPPQPAHAATVTAGNYCSLTKSDGAWAFVSNSNGGDPCGAVTSSSSGWSIRRKGLYSPTGRNNVVVRCNSGQNWVGTHVGTGNAPLTAAYNSAKSAAKSHCVFTVAPASLPVFNAPFDLTRQYTHYTGYDFAKAPYNTLNVTAYGQTGSTTARVVDWKARDKSGLGYLDDHDGHDYVMARGTPIRSVSDGVVIMARNFSTTCTGSDSKLQREVAIKHTVWGANGYYEQFVSYYAHLNSYSVAVGQKVAAGQQIGLSGNTGCSSPPHLHFSVVRLTNTASTRITSVTFYDDSRHNSARGLTISPYGFAPPRGFDPWAWRAYPSGALSINLWKSGAAPSTGSW